MYCGTDLVSRASPYYTKREKGSHYCVPMYVANQYAAHDYWNVILLHTCTQPIAMHTHGTVCFYLMHTKMPIIIVCQRDTVVRPFSPDPFSLFA